MRGPFYNPKTGVTGEPNDFRSAQPNLHTYADPATGKVRTRVLAQHTVEEDGDQN